MSAFAAKPRARPSPSSMQRMPAKAPMLGISNIRPSSPGLFHSAGPAIGLGPGVQRQDAAADIVSGSHSARPSARAEIQRALEQAGSAPSPRLPGDRQQVSPIMDGADGSRERAAEKAMIDKPAAGAPPMAAPGAASPPPGPAVAAALAASDGEPLPEAERAVFEPKLGAELSDVRLHDDAAAHAAARALHAQAFTVGHDVGFAAGRYAPGTTEGKRLLAHELAHVVRGRGQPSTIRRKPEPARLDVVVPDPSTVAPFKPDYDYAWQNPLVRKTVFPGRDSAFRSFLLIEKEKDLRAELAGSGFTAAMATDIGAKILAERKRLNDELAEHARLRKQAEGDLRVAQQALKQHLAEPDVREQARKKQELDSKRKRLARNAEALQARIAELERQGKDIRPGEQRELDTRRGMLADISTELATTSHQLDEVSGEFETGIMPFSSVEAKLKGQIQEHKVQEAAQRAQLERVGGGVDAKKKATQEAAIQWRLHEFAQQIKDLGHDQLLGLILDEFAADKSYTRYPKQVRYLVIHFSGMRYASAHSTWGPPQELLATLKEQEIREEFSAADEKSVEAAAEVTGAAIEGELKSKDVGKSRKTELLAVKQGLEAPATTRAQLFAKNPQEERAFDELEDFTGYRAAAAERGDLAFADELTQRIEQLEKQIGAPELKRIRQRLAEADRRRLEALRDFRVREARRAMNALSDLAALSVLQDMKAAFPPWVWHEVVRRTQLRVNVTDPSWNDPTEAPKGPDPADPATARWSSILKGWPSESTIWNQKHAEAYEIVAIAVVCNQLAEHAQHLFGKDPGQGIRGSVNWYHAKAAEAKAKGASGADQPFLIRPKRAEDFVTGAAVFWAHFEHIKKPAASNMAHLLAGVDFLTEGKQMIRDGLVEGDWTYHIDSTTGDITRTRGQGDDVQTQWFSWQHEATVIDRSGSTVITFETSAGARVHTWPVSSLLDPMSTPWILKEHGDTNVFLGFAPEGKTLPQLDKSLQNILPGRSAL